jgi:predicted outer membrane protein
MSRASYLIAVPLLWLCQAALAQQPQQREPIDPTPPPRGTASFEPPPALAEDAPLTAQTFVIRAAIVNLAETDLAELALSRSQNTAIQSYARRMLDEHRRAQEKLRTVAADTKIALPAMVDKKHQDLKDALKRSEADEFDAGYIKAIVSGHDEAIALFDAASSSKTLPKPLQRYAIEMLPSIRNHRDAAYALQSNTKQTPAPATDRR